ncbi:hypothetical protein V8F20_001208 [Naviculisporaceae sp. PSN 640]
MPSFFKTGLMATLAGSAAAHMMIDFPAPFRSKLNPFSDPAKIDYSMTAPLKPDGSDYPCKGYHVDFGTETGKPTASFAPGQTYNVSIIGGANHGGGSCQISLSYDGGKTFTVIESIIGGCPKEQHYPFTVPADAQTGEAIFSWSWHNMIGNREMYQNCAAVTIGGGSAKRSVQKKRNNRPVVQERAVAYSTRPQIFVANVGNGCEVAEGTPVQYPNPGPDVTGDGSAAIPPVGNCGSSSGGGGGDAGPAPAPTVAPVTPPAPTSVEAPAAPAPTSADAPAAPAPTIPGGVFHTISTDKAAPTPTEAPAGGDVPSSTPAPVAPIPTSEPAPAPPAPVPTTLQTATKPSSAPAAPIATGTPDAGSGSGESGAFTPGTACSPEGQWNCIGGTSFQRCASGAWSAVMQMAPGTKCTVGADANLRFSAGRRTMRARRW